MRIVANVNTPQRKALLEPKLQIDHLTGIEQQWYRARLNARTQKNNATGSIQAVVKNLN